MKLTVTASSNVGHPERNIQYQWQYRAKPSSVVLQSTKAADEAGWTDCTGETNDTLNISKDKVTPALNNYEFRCAVSLKDHKDKKAFSEPVSIKVGYATADSKINLTIKNSGPIVQGKGFSLTASSNSHPDLKYQWFYKTPSKEAISYTLNVTPNDPLEAYTEIDNANTATLNIDAKHVTKELTNTEFLVVGYQENKIVYNTTTFTVNKVNNQPDKNISVSVTGNNDVTTASGATLKATPNCSQGSISNYGYQWYYKQVPTVVESASFFKTSLQATPEDNQDIAGWQRVETNGNGQTLSIPKKYITPNLLNYQFVCVVYDQGNKDVYNASTPTQISTYTQTDIPVDESLVENFMNDVTMTWTKQSLEANCEKVGPENPCAPAQANEVLKNQVANALKILPSNVEKVEIQQGNKILPAQKFATVVTVTLSGNNTFQSFNKQSGGIGSNKETIVNASENVLTIKNESTDIGVQRVTTNLADTYLAYTEELNKIKWSDLNKGYANVWFKYNYAKPLFEAVAKLFNIPVSFVDELAVSDKGVKYPSIEIDSVVTIKVRFLSGVNVQNITYTHPSDTELSKKGSTPKFYAECKGQLWGEITVSGVKSAKTAIA